MQRQEQWAKESAWLIMRTRCETIQAVIENKDDFLCFFLYFVRFIYKIYAPYIRAKKDELQEMVVKVGILKRGILKIDLVGCLSFTFRTVLKLEKTTVTHFCRKQQLRCFLFFFLKIKIQSLPQTVSIRSM